MSALTILLIEDEPETCGAFIECADRLDDLSLVGVTADADEALEMIRDRLPEVIILDLELQKGSKSGLDVLRGMGELALQVKPYVIIVTNSVSDATKEYARSFGVDFIISKRQGGYSEQYVLDFIRPMKDFIQRSYHAGRAQNATPETPAKKKERIIQRIHAELNNVQIAPNVLGYQYLTDGILLTVERPREYLCRDIAKKHDKTEASVERAMETAIKRAWQTGDIDKLLKHYTAPIKSEKGVPTLMEFISYYATKLRDEYSV